AGTQRDQRQDGEGCRRKIAERDGGSEVSWERGPGNGRHEHGRADRPERMHEREGRESGRAVDRAEPRPHVPPREETEHEEREEVLDPEDRERVHGRRAYRLWSGRPFSA